MQALRSIAAVILGYLMFALSAVLSFRISGQAPHAPAKAATTPTRMWASMIPNGAGGYVAALLAGRKPAAHGIAVALLLALGAAVSLVSTIGHGAIWSQVAALLVMAPGAAFGGWVRARRG